MTRADNCWSMTITGLRNIQRMWSLLPLRGELGWMECVTLYSKLFIRIDRLMQLYLTSVQFWKSKYWKILCRYTDWRCIPFTDTLDLKFFNINGYIDQLERNLNCDLCTCQDRQIDYLYTFLYLSYLLHKIVHSSFVGQLDYKFIDLMHNFTRWSQME